MKHLLWLAPLLWLVLLLPAMAVAQEQDPAVTGSQENPTTLSDEAIPFSSGEGEFRVVFPPGCAKLVSKTSDDQASQDPDHPNVLVTITYCDRFQKKGEGCSVSSFFNVQGKDGEGAGTEQVIERIGKFLKTMKVNVNHEYPIKKMLPDSSVVQGFDVLASDPAGVGQAWIRGLLYQGDIYVMSAWNSSGGLWDDPEFQNFFNSFQPGAEE